MSSKTKTLKFDEIKANYLAQGQKEDLIDYAISEVQMHTKRNELMGCLTDDHMNMSPLTANALLNDLYEANGGEFTRENRFGFLWAIGLIIFAGVLFLFYYTLENNQDLNTISNDKLKGISISFTGLFLILGIITLVLSFLGKFRTNLIDIVLNSKN
jgi:hypothetical protein